VRDWFLATFGQPTPAQAQAWPVIARGEHTLVLAPTGSGKTLAAFLWAIDRMARAAEPDDRNRRTRLVYVSPLRALAVDVERNLRAPLAGAALAAERLGVDFHVPTVGVRTGDTPAAERRRLVRHPPDILITTPESLYLMLTSAARDTLVGVEAVIVDEIHALVPTKRGAHLSLTLERLTRRAAGPVQRIGLSATQRPLDVVGRFLGGFEPDPSGEPAAMRPRPVTLVDTGVRKQLEVEVVVPVEDMGALGEIVEDPVSGPAAAGPTRRSIWPSVHPRILELIEANRSTIVFVNARRLAERLASRLNELALGQESRGAEADGLGVPEDSEVGDVVKAHHGSLARVRRLLVEDELKRGELCGIVATSSLELGIDMGAVDLVVQVGSPGSVASGLQRIGRAGHQVGAPSRGVVFPKHRADLLEAAAVVGQMHAGLVEPVRYPRNALDVLAQQLVAACALDEWDVDDLAAMVRGAAGYVELSDDLFHATLDLLAGRFPSEEFGELRARVVWDRAAGTVRGRSGAQRLAVTNAGTIPDRGLFGVFLPDGTRVGELDEEMVYESRPGETFLLGASTWRIEDITFERVIVTPAPGLPGKMPFWHGDGPGRPLELGRAVGALTRELRAADHDDGVARLRSQHGLDALAADNLMAYLAEQAEATGSVPDDRTIVVERFRDEIGDWRVCLLSPFGARVHAPWALAIQARLRDRLGEPIEMVWSDDGIVLRLPEAVEDVPLDDLLPDPDELDELVVAHLPSSSLFASRFREAAARALLLPRRRPDQRTPLWQQRQRAADLLAVAAKHPDFPILLETTRELCQDHFDLDALRQVLSGIRARSVRVATAETRSASPMAQSLLFSWIAVYMYEGDAPLAERRAAALALDRDLLRELLGADELRELLDVDVLAELEDWLQRRVDGRRARDADEVTDLLRGLGLLSFDELVERCDAGAGVVAGWVDELIEARRAVRAVVAGDERFAAAEDAGRLRDALGVALPLGLPGAFTESVADPLGDLVARYARTHGPFRVVEVGERLGVGDDRVEAALARLEALGTVVLGEFRPGGVEREWCDDGVLRQLRRRSLAALRHEVEPVEAPALARFLPVWHGVGASRRGPDALAEAVTLLQGAAIPASVLEADVLPARVEGYSPADLDALLASGELVWSGASPLGARDGRLRLAWTDQAAFVVPSRAVDDPDRPDDALHQALRAHLAERGASFWADLLGAAHAADEPYEQGAVLDGLWDLVWAGEVTNDTFAPVRSLVSGGRGGRGGSAARTPSRGGIRRGVGRAPLRSLRPTGPPSAAGRWSLVATLRGPEPDATEVAHGLAVQLLERHGVLTREAVLAEGVPGGFAGIYPVLRALEERGQVRRGWFVDGLGAAQFALPGAADRLRDHRQPARKPDGVDGVGEDPPPVVLAATDPAQPYGAALSWPEPRGGRAARTAGAHVVLVDGDLCALVEKGGRSLVSFDATDRHPGWIAGLVDLVRSRRLRRMELRTVDGAPVRESTLLDGLVGLGFRDGYKGLILRG
jgi:ATP-dependent Lhr-like helicase